MQPKLPSSVIGNSDVNQFSFIVIESPQFRSILTLRYDVKKKALKVLKYVNCNVMYIVQYNKICTVELFYFILFQIPVLYL